MLINMGFVVFKDSDMNNIDSQNKNEYNPNKFGLEFTSSFQKDSVVALPPIVNNNFYLKDVVDVAMGKNYTLFVLKNGLVAAAGWNLNGIGNNTITTQRSIEFLKGFEIQTRKFVSASSSSTHCFALTEDGVLFVQFFSSFSCLSL